MKATVRHFDVAIVGGGLAGSTTAAMLGRAGHRAVLVDPHPLYPKDFRSEKLDDAQVALLHATGLGEAVYRAATIDQNMWIARFGRVVEKRPSAQYDILYDDLVNTIRAEIVPPTEIIHAKARSAVTSVDRQHLSLSTGEEISARLLVLANGLNIGLRKNVGIECEVISPCHSISLAFDVRPIDRKGFPFRALTYYAEDVASRVAYLTLFPIGAATRVNMFVYRDLHDPWIREIRCHPRETLFAALPRLRALTGDIEVSEVQIRPVDLYVSRRYQQAGIVLVGDAFASSCPAAGTGCNKVFTDVERLCNVHIPRWLTTPGMAIDKIATFYDDPIKRACDRFSADKAFYIRAHSTETMLSWRARRFGKFLAHLAKGYLRRVGERLSIMSPPGGAAPARGSAA
jgi:2-polyprenyl-6-methoxyphenol hydroxylase-like FAD-dependent oxidoreductase